TTVLWIPPRFETFMYRSTNVIVPHITRNVEEKGEISGGDKIYEIVYQGGISDFSVEDRSVEVNHE
ncbi:MAG: hypothetical protein LN409_04680, partial [Candidatus Thermoplasmatota archaeon]|nr:hypothetical protein [Candidatus Thermoplasmatota archaeon]